MALNRINVFIHIHGEPNVGIFPFTDEIELQWDLDEYPDERERVRKIIREAWVALYDNNDVDVNFGDECPDCLCTNGIHKPDCPSFYM